jgi:hypothetical protein
MAEVAQTSPAISTANLTPDLLAELRKSMQKAIIKVYFLHPIFLCAFVAHMVRNVLDYLVYRHVK